MRTTVPDSQKVTKFESEFFREFVRGGKFDNYIGVDYNNIIVMREGRGRVNIPLIGKLNGNGVKGSETLRGREEKLDSYGMILDPTYRRNAVTITKEDLEKPAYDLMEAARPALMEWAKEKIKYQMVDALMGIKLVATPDGAYKNYEDATASELDTWLTNNSDRVIFGASKSNTVAGDFTASLANVDTTNDKLTGDKVSLYKRIAKGTNPKIKPYQIKDGGDAWYLYFIDPLGMRDLRSDTKVLEANERAWERGRDNPIFRGGDLLWDGIIIRELEEIGDRIDGGADLPALWGSAAAGDKLNIAGASSSRVGVGFMLGQGALGYGLGQRPKFKVDTQFDYEFQPGVAVEFKNDIQKAYFNGKQHGILTTFYSASADA